MSKLLEYYQIVNERLAKILEEESENIELAAEMISETLKNEDNLLHIFGTGGHSTMSATEVFDRAGGLAQIDPIFFSEICLENGGRKAKIERVPGIAPMIMDAHTFKRVTCYWLSPRLGSIPSLLMLLNPEKTGDFM